MGEEEQAGAPDERAADEPPAKRRESRHASAPMR
jgi:hypothetical protein